MRYKFLVNILDGIINEAPPRYSKKYPKIRGDADQKNQARARAMIHLYLKVNFGITDFEQRERFVTDGGYDGGIDAYYINQNLRVIYLIQSKFRATEVNFDSKEITVDELFSMDVDRILSGCEKDEYENDYSGKIKQLQREVGEIEDIARYRYVIVILANLKDPPQQKLRQLFGGHAFEVVDAERMYKELVFPVLCGTYFTASDITIPIDLSNKISGGKISYEVLTRYATCQITVLFVPAIEIAKIMHTYKNAVLKFNPRSYLEHEGQSVNNAIRQTIMCSDANELALYNNGITMLSEETSFNEKIGQKGRAQLYVKNPQIINGGQTSFTLSRIYSDPDVDAEKVLSNKEIMLKVITVSECSADDKGKLIDEISVATNRQTPVINADRFANDSFHKVVQQIIFNRYGALYERKRGEFADGIRDGYIKSSSVIERNGFWRIYYAANGNIELASQKRLFQKNIFDHEKIIADLSAFDRWSQGFVVYSRLLGVIGSQLRFSREHYAMIFACVELWDSVTTMNNSMVDQVLFDDKGFWGRFVDAIQKRYVENPQSFPSGLERKGKFSKAKYFNSHGFTSDIRRAVNMERRIKRDGLAQ